MIGKLILKTSILVNDEQSKKLTFWHTPIFNLSTPVRRIQSRIFLQISQLKSYKSFNKMKQCHRTLKFLKIDSNKTDGDSQYLQKLVLLQIEALMSSRRGVAQPSSKTQEFHKRWVKYEFGSKTKFYNMTKSRKEYF